LLPSRHAALEGIDALRLLRRILPALPICAAISVFAKAQPWQALPKAPQTPGFGCGHTIRGFVFDALDFIAPCGAICCIKSRKMIQYLQLAYASGIKKL
jgi:hypothetical protein